MKNTGNILAALVVGAVVGAAAGILLAPDKGSETRKKLLSGAKDLGEDLKGKFLNSVETTEDLSAGTEEKRDLEEFYHNVHSASNPVATA